MVPHEFIRIEFRGVRRQEEQLKVAAVDATNSDRFRSRCEECLIDDEENRSAMKRTAVMPVAAGRSTAVAAPVFGPSAPTWCPMTALRLCAPALRVAESQDSRPSATPGPWRAPVQSPGTGRWGVSPSERKSRPTEARLRVTPQCCRIRSRTIARVQRARTATAAGCSASPCDTPRRAAAPSAWVAAPESATPVAPRYHRRDTCSASHRLQCGESQTAEGASPASTRCTACMRMSSSALWSSERPVSSHSP